MSPAEYDFDSGAPGELVRIPYRPFPEVLGSTLPTQVAAGAALRAIGGWPARLARPAGQHAALTPVRRLNELFEDPRRSARMARARYPRLADFLALRATCDPDGIFVTDYWRAHLGLDAGAPSEVPSFTRSERRTARFPLLFRLRPLDDDFAANATGIFRNRASIPAAPADVFRAFAEDEGADEWFTDLHDIGRPGGRLDGVGAVADLNYHYMTVRVRYVAYDPGRLLRAVVDAWSLPLCERMGYEVRFDPRRDGGTDFAWDVFYDPFPAFARLVPLVRPLFARLFRKTTADFARHVGERYSPRFVGSRPRGWWR